MDEAKRAAEWYRRQVDKEAGKDVLPRSELIGQVVGVVAILVFLAFFVLHQTRETGFFTSEFGALEAALFYSSGAFGLIPSLTRLFTGRKNPARFFDGIGSGLMFVAIAYLLAVFPFDFSHLAEPLPGAIEFLLDWVTDGLAKVVMVVAMIVTLFTTPYTFTLYFAVRKRLTEGVGNVAGEQ